MNPQDCYVTTTAGEKFDYRQFSQLAHLVYKRFGNNLASATAAWRRMLENDATESDFQEMLGMKDYEPPQLPNIPPDAEIFGLRLMDLHGGLTGRNLGVVLKIEIHEAKEVKFRKRGKAFRIKGTAYCKPSGQTTCDHRKFSVVFREWLGPVSGIKIGHRAILSCAGKSTQIKPF